MNYQADKDEQEGQLKRFLSLKMLETENLSAKFLDFLRECLMF